MSTRRVPKFWSSVYSIPGSHKIPPLNDPERSVKSCFTLEGLALMRNLSGMANNLNQVAQKANLAGFRRVETEAVFLLCQILVICL